MSEGVLAICAQKNRDLVRKALAATHFKLSFISALSEVNSAIVEFKPRILIHDWAAVDISQARQFHLKFGRTSQSNGIVRVLLVPEATPSLLAFANDALIEKVLTYGSASLTLGNELAMLISSRESNELAKLLRESKDEGARYNQQELDEKIEELYTKYPHDLKVKLEFGNLSFRQRKFDDALRLAEDILHKEETNLRAMNLKARSLMKSGDWEKALAVLGEANVLSPSNPERLIMMGDAFYGKGDLDQAMAYYQEASDADPSDCSMAQKQMGKVHIDQGRMEDALSMFKGSASEEEAAGYFNNAAVIAVRNGKLEQAIKLYHTALKAVKTNRLKPQIYFNIALTLRRLDLENEAIKCLKRSLHYDPSFEKAKAQLDDIMKQGGKRK